MGTCRQVLTAWRPRDACIFLAPLQVRHPQLYRLHWQLVGSLSQVSQPLYSEQMTLREEPHNPAGPCKQSRHHANSCSVLDWRHYGQDSDVGPNAACIISTPDALRSTLCRSWGICSGLQERTFLLAFSTALHFLPETALLGSDGPVPPAHQLLSGV